MEHNFVPRWSLLFTTSSRYSRSVGISLINIREIHSNWQVSDLYFESISEVRWWNCNPAKASAKFVRGIETLRKRQRSSPVELQHYESISEVRWWNCSTINRLLYFISFCSNDVCCSHSLSWYKETKIKTSENLLKIFAQILK